MISNKECVNIACANSRIAQALSRYFKFCLGFEEIVINPLSNPYRFPDAVKMAGQCDLLIVDTFFRGEPKGFHFARQIGKKTLLLFYSGELDVENEGSFWLVFPHKLCQLSKKIRELMKESVLHNSIHIELQNRFSILSETKGHHE